MKNPSPELQDLLRLCQVQSSYLDVNKQRQRATTEALLALLRGLDVPIEQPEHAGQWLGELQRRKLLRGVEPVQVAWNGRLKSIAVALPTSVAGSLEYAIDLDGRQLASSVPLDSLASASPPEAAESGYRIYRLPILHRLPTGYHPLQLRVGNRQFDSLIVSAPRQAFKHDQASAAGASEQRARQRAWGAFLPLYALRRTGDWGAGDFTALGELAAWTGKLGGRAVGTLPLLAASLDEPYEPSPYRPVSRQFWNEFYIDVEAVPELRSCDGCRSLIEAVDFRRQLRELSEADLVDYRRGMSLKRQALRQLAAHFFQARPAERFAAFERFRSETSDIESYARFCAARDRRRSGWMAWPEAMHAALGEGDLDPRDYHYHLYVQWIAAEQLGRLEQTAAAAGCGLYLDLPVGVDPGGFDVWQHKEIFVVGASTGAPPDPFFTRGQDWGLPPLHPERIRETGYAHLRQVLAANMRYARYLRIDHAMGWHRLYWIAPGLRADQGAYVSYAADEFYAVASVESHRHRCTLLAENLGTVPPEVGKALDRHGIGGMWVAPYELEPSRRAGLNAPPPLSVASLNTHDMPPAAAWWSAADVADRLDLGLITAEEARAERIDRAAAIDMLRSWLRESGYLPLVEEGARSDRPPIAALLRAIAGSPAQLVLVTLEDLWQETRSQNVPGTLHERPNWQRKARYALEEFTRQPDVIDALSQVNQLR